MHISSAHKERLGKIARVATASAMVVSSLGIAVTSTAQAARMTETFMTLSDTRPDQTSTYTLSFKPTSTTAIKQVNIKICGQAGNYADTCDDPTSGGDGGTSGASFSAAGTTLTGFGGGSGPDNAVGGGTTVSGNVFNIIVNAPGANESASTAHTIAMTGQTNASQQQSYYARIVTYSDTGTTSIDTAQTAYALVTPVTVSGTVLENLTFTVGVDTAGACGTSGDTVTATTATATAIPFGNYSTNTPRVGCQTVATGTNAANGYDTFVKTVNPGAAPQGAMCRQTAANCNATGGLNTVASGNYIADTGLSSTAASWTNGTTFGLGVNAYEGRAPGGGGGFSSATVYKQVVGANGVQIQDYSGPDTAGSSLTYVAYKSDVPANQTAGIYQNQLEYSVLPSF